MPGPAARSHLQCIFKSEDSLRLWANSKTENHKKIEHYISICSYQGASFNLEMKIFRYNCGTCWPHKWAAAFQLLALSRLFATTPSLHLNFGLLALLLRWSIHSKTPTISQFLQFWPGFLLGLVFPAWWSWQYSLRPRDIQLLVPSVSPSWFVSYSIFKGKKKL